MFDKQDVSKIVDQVVAARAEEIKERVAAAANRKVDELLNSVQIQVRISERELAGIVGFSPDTVARLRKARKIQYRGLPGHPYYLFPADVEAFHETLKTGVKNGKS